MQLGMLGYPFYHLPKKRCGTKVYVIRDGGGTQFMNIPQVPLHPSYLVDSLSIQSEYLSGNLLIISILVAPNRLTKHLQDPHIPPAALSE